MSKQEDTNFLKTHQNSPMDRKPTEPKRSGKDMHFDETAEDDDDESLQEEDKKIRTAAGTVARRGPGGGSAASQPACQAEKCGVDLSEAKRYHRRHKVCEAHSKAPVVVVAGLRQRFCQQCSRFHELSEFDDAKRSCRRRLAGHNERRRKSSSETQGESSNRCGQPEQGSSMQISINPGSPAAYKHFQIR